MFKARQVIFSTIHKFHNQNLRRLSQFSQTIKTNDFIVNFITNFANFIMKVSCHS